MVRDASRSASEAAPVRPGRRLSHVGIVLLMLSAIFFGFNFAHEWILSQQIEQTAAQLQQKIDQTNAQNQQLQNQLAYLDSKEYIVPTARARLGMAQRGDTLMRVVVGPPTIHIVRVHEAAPSPPQSLFSRLLRAIFQ